LRSINSALADPMRGPREKFAPALGKKKPAILAGGGPGEGPRPSLWSLGSLGLPSSPRCL